MKVHFIDVGQRNDVHNDLSDVIDYMEDFGFIEDITPGNCTMYRMYENFVDKLRNA